MLQYLGECLSDTLPGKAAAIQMGQANVLWNIIVSAKNQEKAEKVIKLFAEKNQPLIDLAYEKYWKIDDHFQVHCRTSFQSYNCIRKWLAILNDYAHHWHLMGMHQTIDTYHIEALQSQDMTIPGITFIHSQLEVIGSEPLD